MNTKFLLRDVLSSLKKLDQQGHYKIADKIFNKIANELDISGLHKEATSLTNVMKRLADESDFNQNQDCGLQ